MSPLQERIFGLVARGYEVSFLPPFGLGHLNHGSVVVIVRMRDASAHETVLERRYVFNPLQPAEVESALYVLDLIERDLLDELENSLRGTEGG